MRKRSERRDSVFVLQADNDTDKIGEIFTVDSAVFHMFKQVLVERILTGWGGHRDLHSNGLGGISPKAKVGGLLFQYAGAAALVNRCHTGLVQGEIGKICLAAK